MKLVIFFFYFLFFIFNCSSQYSISEELKFTQYLIDNNQYRDAIFILKKQNTSEQKTEVADSINYYLGWCYYNFKILDSSEIYFSKVKTEPFYKKSAFYTMFNQAYQKKSVEAKTSLQNISTGTDSSLAKLKNLEFAGISLLEKDYQSYEARAKNFSGNYFPISQEEKNFSAYYSQLKKMKKKSPALAGMMSAIIPGSGKFYAGYKGQALASLMMVGILGISTAESYYRPFERSEKKGYKNAEFITLGSLFTIFYIGNIWGSTLSVKLAREHAVREINDQILFDMHIPIRRIFN
ncbi:MAG: hypothetical protein HY063_07085 [Bacteroidetes bacterium]|nr:hypothetical protein [Bacteroidota bacterium]